MRYALWWMLLSSATTCVDAWVLPSHVVRTARQHSPKQHHHQRQQQHPWSSLVLLSAKAPADRSNQNPRPFFATPPPSALQVAPTSESSMTDARNQTDGTADTDDSVAVAVEQVLEEAALLQEQSAEAASVVWTEPNGDGLAWQPQATPWTEDQMAKDVDFMRKAVQQALRDGGEDSPTSAYPRPTVGALLVSGDDRETILGRGTSDYATSAVAACVRDTGLDVTALSQWCVGWPADGRLRDALRNATLYVTLEPSAEAYGTAQPPLTQLIRQIPGLRRVVIGHADPRTDRAYQGAAALHAAGLEVTLLVQRDDAEIHTPKENEESADTTRVSAVSAVVEECASLIPRYTALVTDKLQRMARKHFEQFQRPLGFLHCSVVDSDNIEAFKRHGNAFGTNFGGKFLSYRDFGAYEIAPPPEMIWADDDEDDLDDFDDEDDDDDDTSLLDVDFADEMYQEALGTGNPMMPWYEQVNAICATFPKPGNGPADDDSLTARLKGLRWLATHGQMLPAGVERILVMDATDLADLPLTNDSHEAWKGLVDVETFWKAPNRKPTRVLLRRGVHAQARAAAETAAAAAKAAAEAAQAAAAAVESGDAAKAAQAAVECQQSAQAATDLILHHLEEAQSIKMKLESMGVLVEILEGGDPIDVMEHLGARSGYHSVVWRAGCWGDRGVQSILAGAFQWVSAHLAVDAVGGKYWQLMLAQNAIQAACGPERKVKVFAEQEDISLEYCDSPEVDQDCVVRLDGRPVRHIRLDCRIALFDEDRPREFVTTKTAKLDEQRLAEKAPWFL